MREILVVVVASLGSAAALTALANIYVKFAQKRARKAVPYAQLRSSAAADNGAVINFAIRFAAAGITVAVLCSEPVLQVSVIRGDLLNGDAQSLSASAGNALSNASV
jgi:hypothetical protein